MLIIANANEVATCQSSNAGPKTGEDLSSCGVIQNGAVVIENGTIVAVGTTKDVLRKFRQKKSDEVIDASGNIVVPGFIDCHTHAVFAGSRAEEYELKLRGASYEAIHTQKGGIHLTVRATRAASEEELFAEARKKLHRMFASGTTTLEIKSGYGLTADDELKILRAVKRLGKSEPQDIVATFLGAHTVPLEYEGKREEYVREIVKRMLPAVAEERLAEYCDVFCDPLGFTPEETRNIFRNARELGLKLRIHAEQTAHFGGAQVAAEFGAASADHCDYASDEDIRLLAQQKTPMVLLPGVYLHLAEWSKKPKMREMVEKAKSVGVPFVVATDYNPGSSPVPSMKTAMDLAMRFFGMSYGECLNAATINAAHALGRGDTLGSVEQGKQADLLIVDAPTVKDFLHEMGDRRIVRIIKKGRIYRV